MFLLRLASIACWAVTIDKSVKLVRLKRQVGWQEAMIRADGVQSPQGATSLAAANLAAAHR